MYEIIQFIETSIAVINYSKVIFLTMNSANGPFYSYNDVFIEFKGFMRGPDDNSLQNSELRREIFSY